MRRWDITGTKNYEKAVFNDFGNGWICCQRKRTKHVFNNRWC